MVRRVERAKQAEARMEAEDMYAEAETLRSDTGMGTPLPVRRVKRE